MIVTKINTNLVRKTVNIWLLGGFGNILFQILASRVIIKNGKKIKFVNVLTEKNFLTRAIGWTIHQPLYGELVSKKHLVKKHILLAGLIVFVGMISKVFKIKLKMATFYGENTRLNQPYAQNIFGYFQNKIFLQEHKNEILALGRDIRKIYGTDPSSVIVHYRNGDSVWAKKHQNYYSKVREMIKKESSNVIVVTDSPIDAKSFFLKNNNIEISSSKNALNDFKVLLSAKKLYCAPSTFSWWAAHSLEKEAQIIIPAMFREFMGVYLQKDKVIEI